MTAAGRSEAISGWLGGEALPPGALDRLASYLDLLRLWRRRLDLVGQVSEEQLVRGLVRGALAGLAFMPPAAGRLLDVGSGAGIPAVPLLLARPGLRGVLLEPRERRWAFLREVVRELSLPAEVVRESAKSHGGAGYGVLSVRGVRPDLWWSELGKLLADDGVALWWTGGEKCSRWQEQEPEGRVVLCPLPPPGRGGLLVYRRCFT